MRWIWIGGAVIMAAAAVSVWVAFQNPQFVAGLTAVAIGAAWKAVAPDLLKPASDEKLRAMKKCRDSGREWDHIRNGCREPR